jgi:hypothetical protein
MITPQTVFSNHLMAGMAEVDDDEEVDYGAEVRPVNPPTNCCCSAKTENQEEVKPPFKIFEAVLIFGGMLAPIIAFFSMMAAHTV